MDFTPSAADALGINRTFPVLAEEDFALHNKYYGSAKYVGKPIMDEILALIRNTQGTYPQNDIINGPCEFFQRGGISGAVAMGDATYTAPDRFYSLIQGSGATEQRVAAPVGFASRYVLQLVSGGTTNRFGKATVLEAYQSVPMRGQSKTFSFRVRASKNAGSGTINVRAAILEWTGTADSIGASKDVVNNWASSTYTAGNFFNSTTLNVIAVSPQIAVSHGVSQQVTLTGTFGSSLNNTILMVWVQDVPAHAADLIQLGELGLYQGTYAPTLWQPRPPANELALCQRYCWAMDSDEGETNYGPALKYSTRFIEPYFKTPVTMRGSAVFSSSGVSGWNAGAPGAGQIAGYDYLAGAYATISGALSLSGGGSRNLVYATITAATSFSTTDGRFVLPVFGTGIKMIWSAEL